MKSLISLFLSTFVTSLIVFVILGVLLGANNFITGTVGALLMVYASRILLLLIIIALITYFLGKKQITSLASRLAIGLLALDAGLYISRALISTFF